MNVTITKVKNTSLWLKVEAARFSPVSTLQAVGRFGINEK